MTGGCAPRAAMLHHRLRDRLTIRMEAALSGELADDRRKARPIPGSIGEPFDVSDGVRRSTLKGCAAFGRPVPRIKSEDRRSRPYSPVRPSIGFCRIGQNRRQRSPIGIVKRSLRVTAQFPRRTTRVVGCFALSLTMLGGGNASLRERCRGQPRTLFRFRDCEDGRSARWETDSSRR